MKLPKLLKLPKLRKLSFYKWNAITWVYVTVFTSTYAVAPATDNPALFFFLILASLLIMHQIAYDSGQMAAFDQIEKNMEEARQAMDSLMRDRHVKFNITVEDKESPPDNVVKLH